MIRLRDVLFKKNFFCLWSGQIISEFGDRLNQMALISLVYSKEPGSVMALARLLFFIMIPVFVIGPFAGVYVDRWDRKRVMIIADLARGLAALAIPLFVIMDNMIGVYALVFFIFSATRFFLPSKMAMIPSIVSKEKLMVANSLAGTTRMIATLVGFAIAGILVKMIGYMSGFYLNAASYFISGILIFVITPKKELANLKEDFEITKEAVEKGVRRNVLGEIAEGFKSLARKDKMRIASGTFFLLMAGSGAVFCVIIVFIQEAFGSITEILGLFGAFLGGGLFAGTIIFGKYGQKFSKIRSIYAGLFLCGLAVNAFALGAKYNPSFIVGGMLIFVVGLAAGPVMVCINTLIHELMPDEVRGKVFSSMEALIHLAFMVCMFLTAYLSKFLSNYIIIAGTGLSFAIIGAIGYFSIKGQRAN